ncbi:MAG: ABC transporter permease [Gemmataceae bacterium]
MIRLVGVFVVVLVLYAGMLASDPFARTLSNHEILAGRLGFYGMLTLGVGILIIAGGIDLSIGSVVGLGAVCFGMMLERGVSPWVAAAVTLVGSAGIGLVHGLLVTGLGLQPFLVTLCGLFIYRGVAQWATPNPVGLGERPEARFLRELLVGAPGEGGRNQLLVLLAVTVVLTLFVHGTRYGRYLFAIGANENAARYAGVPTNRYKILAYVICSAMAGIGAVLYLLNSSSVDPNSAGSWLELYAITGAVLGGCSLRGGEGIVPGMVLGAAVLPLIRSLCGFNKVGNEIEFAVVGFALLLGTIADELLKRRAARRPA